MRSLRKDFQDTSMYRKWVEDKRERTTELTTAKRVYENMYKERPEKNAHPRYIWFKVTRGEITIYVFRKAYLREECEREVKEGKYKSWYESHKLTDDENAELDEMFDELTVVNGKEPLPDQYQRYEENPRRFENAQECIFYEMQEWVDGYNLVSDKYKALIYNDLCTLFVDHTKQPLQDKEFFVHKIDETPYTIVYRMDASNIATTSIYLIHIGEQVNMPSLREKRYDTPKISTLQRKAKKCYPDFILCSYEAWLGVEDDSQANLALSDEELRILQQIQYPFYVSGLAGSGKSTVLYYLFAHAYDFMAKHHPDQRMLFLSYSNKLVKNAKDIVKAILRYNPAYGIAEKEAFSDKEQENRFDGCFQPFQQFIRNEFLDEEELSIFAPDCYIDYQGFKTLYETCQLPEKKRYSPDIVWSVIRTYIKGRERNHYFTPEEYNSEKLSNKDITVDIEDYRNIYKIFDSWYRKICGEMGPKWDDLDLVRYAINKRGISSKYHSFSVVYCDEAQDFTKIETDLILKLLIHSKYDLTQHLGDDKIPVAFAGDPNQTINPTGFRWGSMQEIFTRSFEESLGDFRGLEAEMLEINYRSHEGVVKFANAIQFLRHRLLSDSKQKLTLQRAWNSDDDTSSQDTSEMSYVAYYSLDKYRPQIMAGMQKAIILTSDEGEYSPIDRDMENEPESFEKHLWKTTETRKSELGLPEDVANSRLYTAMTAKGLEFKGVILYRFSSDPAINLFESLIQGTQTLTDSDLYKLAHFFTKLYIAISRAKQVLFVVDTDHGYDKFWRYFIEPELWEHYIAPKIEQSRANDVNRLSMGNIADFATLLSENFNPKELADYYYRTALEEESKDTMNRALSCYAMAKYYDRVDHCKAHILLFDKEYVKAGRQFVELLEYQNALEAFWRGKCWDMVITTIQDMGAAGMSMEMRRLIARYMRGDIKVDVFLDKCLQVEDALHENVISNRDLWHEILQKTENEANRLDDLSLSATFMSNLSSFSRYFQSYDNGMQSLRALLHYRKGIFKNVGNTVAIKDTDLLEAIRLWTAKGDINRKEYYTAKKLTATDTSDEIRWMSRLGESQSIIDRFGTPEASLILNDEARGIVFSILLQRDYQAAINYPYPKDLYVKWQRLFTHNHSAFLSLVVLSGYDTKAFDFLETQITEADKPIDVLSPEIFEKIFALREVHGGAPYWTRFVRLTNNDGFRAFFNEQNSTIALDVLSNKLCENAEYDKDMASCFLEVLFGKNFSLRRAEKYHAAFLRIFGKDVFFKEDFRNATRRNKYFSEYITVSNEELDLIKDNVRKYIQYKFESTKKAAKNNETEIQTMVKAYEICVPYQATSPDYAHIVSMLNRWIKDSKFSRIKPWLSTRAALNRLLSDAIEQRASYTSFKKHIDEIGITLTEAVQDFSREDAVAFIAAVFQNPEYDFDLMVMVARLLHGRRLQRENFRTLCNVNTLAVNISTYVRTALQEELSRPRLNVPVVKWLTFTWESILDNASAAENYDLFLRDNRRRLSRMGKLKDYLMRRALLHYSTMAASLFEAKKDEYNISMTKEYLPAKFPEIGDKTDDTPSTEPIEDKPMDPEKESQLDMAKQLKALGNTAQQIAPLLKLLTIEEIEYL